MTVPSKPASLTKIKKYFKWQPYYNLNEGLEDMVKILKKMEYKNEIRKLIDIVKQQSFTTNQTNANTI